MQLGAHIACVVGRKLLETLGTPVLGDAASSGCPRTSGCLRTTFSSELFQQEGYVGDPARCAEPIHVVFHLGN